jgi:hypothetical protein
MSCISNCLDLIKIISFAFGQSRVKALPELWPALDKTSRLRSKLQVESQDKV